MSWNHPLTHLFSCSLGSWELSCIIRDGCDDYRSWSTKPTGNILGTESDFYLEKKMYWGPILHLIKAMELEKPMAIPDQLLVPFKWIHLFPFSLFPLMSHSKISPRLTWWPLHNSLILQEEVSVASPASVQGGLPPSLIKSNQSWSDSCLTSRFCLLIIMPQLNGSFGSKSEWPWSLEL